MYVVMLIFYSLIIHENENCDDKHALQELNITFYNEDSIRSVVNKIYIILKIILILLKKI